ncbi:MAG: DUF4367 domain-containing protein [Anaerolineaceae bacterium]
MNSEKMKSLLIQHFAEESIPEVPNAWQIIQNRAATEFQENFMREPHNRSTPLIRLGITFGVIFLIVALLLIKLPDGSALAERIKHLFNISSATMIPYSHPNEGATPTFAPTYKITLVPVVYSDVVETPKPETRDENKSCEEDPYGYFCEIALAEKKAGFNAKEFPSIPKGLKFDDVYVTDNDVLIISYSAIGGGGYLYLTQGMGTEAESLSSPVLESEIKYIQIGDYSGEFVEGMYITTGDPPVYTWSSTGAKRLIWTDGEKWYELYSLLCLGPNLSPTQEDLIQMAIQLVDEPYQNRDLNPEFLSSVEDASELAGFLILTPNILPKDFTFSYASYDKESSQVTLIYRPEGAEDSGVAEITILESPIDESKPIDEFDETIKWETIEIQGKPGKYFSLSEFGHKLIWDIDGVHVILSFYSSDIWYGGGITKEQILDIATSIR